MKLSERMFGLIDMCGGDEKMIRGWATEAAELEATAGELSLMLWKAIPPNERTSRLLAVARAADAYAKTKHAEFTVEQEALAEALTAVEDLL